MQENSRQDRTNMEMGITTDRFGEQRVDSLEDLLEEKRLEEQMRIEVELAMSEEYRKEKQEEWEIAKEKEEPIAKEKACTTGDTAYHSQSIDTQAGMIANMLVIKELLEKQQEEVMAAIDQIDKKVEQMNVQIQAVESANRQMAEETRRSLNSVIQTSDRIHAENQRLKDDMYSKMLKPVLMGLCQVANNINKDIKKEADERTKTKLVDIRDDVVDVCLANLGVEVFEAKMGEEFNELRHRLVKSIATEDAGQHRKIQEVLGQGYLWRKNSEIIVLEPCKVNVYNFKQSK